MTNYVHLSIPDFTAGLRGTCNSGATAKQTSSPQIESHRIPEFTRENEVKREKRKIEVRSAVCCANFRKETTLASKGRSLSPCLDDGS